MLKSLRIKNFKSLEDFELSDLQKFNCLIGLNGAGKTTLLQAFEFLSQLMIGNMENWLKNRGWKPAELCNVLSQKRLIIFEIEIRNNIKWYGEYNISKYRCFSETVSENGKILFKLSEGQYYLENDKYEVMFDYQGSIMSQLKTTGKLSELRDEIKSLKSMELLSPHIMRVSSKEYTEDIGIYGERIHNFLSFLDVDKRKILTENLKKFYPNLSEWDIMSKKFGWKKFFITEIYNKQIRTNANHINDGFLRIIAILAQSLGKHNILLYDEIENGINPEIIEKLIDSLVNLEKQIFVTTHSPLVLNYLEDNIAEKSVRLLYKTKNGDTKSALYFDYPEAKRKLEFFGPGEVYVDTPITDTVDYFNEVNK